MARPLSEAKREAILEAAAEMVAAHGVGASTALIAKAAKVSEGTIFTYFDTKDVLLNELFVRLELRLLAALEDSFPANGDAGAQLRHIWNVVIDWGSTSVTDRKALRQLKVSERITGASRERCDALFGKMLASMEASLETRVDAELVPFYLRQVFLNLVETTLEAIEANPGQRAAFKRAGFELFWKGIQP